MKVAGENKIDVSQQLQLTTQVLLLNTVEPACSGGLDPTYPLVPKNKMTGTPTT